MKSRKNFTATCQFSIPLHVCFTNNSQKMKINQIRLFAGALVLSATLMACGGEKPADAGATTTEPAKAEIPAAVELTIAGNDQMKYDKDRLEAFEGQEVTLTLTHAGKMAKQAMGHNWVLLANGTDMAEFGAASMTAVDTDYVPADAISSGKVIAHTSMIGGGETTKITFTAPAPGVYNFICSFPGHYALMKGTFVSRARP